MHALKTSLITVLLASLLAGLASPQDPPPPPGGFPIRLVEYADGTALGPITWVDGVRTELDIRIPVHSAPPSTGWPMALVVHGGSGTRRNRAVQARAQRLTRRGYVTLAYDVRTDGATLRLNPPGFDGSDADKMRDMAELFARAQSFMPPGTTVDPNRLAVTGDSQGGRHSFRAAGWSGQALPKPIAPYTTMPVITAVAPRIAPVDVAEDIVQDDILMSAQVATNLYRGAPPTDPTLLAILAEDYPTVHSLVAADPVRHYTPRVYSSSVPIFINMAWEDQKHVIHPHLDGAPSNTGPWHFLMSTSGHSTPQNATEEAYFDDQIGRWFDHFMKGVNTGIASEPQFSVAWRPADPARATNTSSAWQHSKHSQWPPASVRDRTLYLRGNGTLTNAPPTTTEPTTVLRHRLLTPTYDMVEFCKSERKLSQVLTDIALDEHRFDTDPLPEDTAIAGRPSVTMTALSTAGDFYVVAALEAVAPDGTTNQIGSGMHGRRNDTPGFHRVTITIDDTAMVVPAGWRLRLVLRNLSIHEPAGQRFMRFVPCFVESDVAISINAGTRPSLTIPTLPKAPATLSPRLMATSPTASGSGVSAPMILEAGSTRAGELYTVLMSASGIYPGFALPGTHVPLNLDAWSTLPAAVGPVRPFTNFAGLLDSQGRARPHFDVGTHPVATSLVGIRFAFVAGGLDSSTGRFWATNPAELVINP